MTQKSRNRCSVESGDFQKLKYNCTGYSLCVVANFGQFQNALMFGILGVFWSGFFYKTSLMWSENRFSHLFGIFNFLTQTDRFAKAIAFASRPTLAIFKMLSFLENWVCFGVVFFTKQVSCCRRIVFRTFLAFLIFDPNRPFCKGYSLCVVANFGHYENAPIFRISGAF